MGFTYQVTVLKCDTNSKRFRARHLLGKKQAPSLELSLKKLSVIRETTKQFIQ